MGKLKGNNQSKAPAASQNHEEILLREHAIVATTDIHGKFIQVSNRFCQLCQYSEEELIGNSFSLLESGYHPQTYYDEMHERVRQGFLWQGVFRNQAKDGSYFWVDQTTTPLKNQSGEIDRYVSFQTDITKRRKIEKKLRNNFDLLATTFESFPGAISVFNKDLAMTMVNKKFYEYLDLSEERFPVGCNYADVIRFNAERGEYGPGDVDELVTQRVELASQFKPHNFERHRPGGISLEIHGLPLPGGGFVTTYLDISARKQADELLARQSKSLSQQAKSMALMNEIAVAANKSKAPLAVFGFMLECVCKFTGWEVGHVYMPAGGANTALQSTKSWYLSEPEKFEIFREKTEKLTFEKNVGFPGKVYASAEPIWIDDLTKESGNMRSLTARRVGIMGCVFLPVLLMDKVVAVVEFFTTREVEHRSDVAEILSHVTTQMGRVIERARAEQSLIAHRDQLQERVDAATLDLKKKADELHAALIKEKELNELQRGFVSMTSHEFRTPLAIIDSSVHRLERNPDKLTKENVEKRLKKIRRAVTRMTRLMESTLSAFQMDAGKIHINIGDCDLVNVIEQVLDRQRDISRQHSIVQDLDGLSTEFKGDAAVLDQVFTNLLSNAVKYSAPHTRITVKGWLEDQTASISITDEGIGIDPEDLPNMFNRYFRAKSSTGIAGTGIGLNLARMLVREHGGEITLESTVGVGSTFTVRLPLAHAIPNLESGVEAA